MEHYSDCISVVDAQGFEHVEATHVAILLGYHEKLGIQHWGDTPAASRDIGPAEQAANARLIAAAPDLLAVANDFNEALGELGMHCECGQPDCRTTRLRAAIAKATGQKGGVA